MSCASLPRSFGFIQRVAQQQIESITMGHLMRNTSPEPAALLRTSQWLHKQLPMRFARRIVDILKLPHVVVCNPHMSELLDTYVETFEKLHDFPDISTHEDEHRFLDLISEQLVKHNPGTRLIAEGYRDVRRLHPEIRLDSFLHDQFTTRIAARILMDNYVAMRTPKEGYLGIVCQGMRALEIVQDIVSELIPLTESLYGCSPDVEYRGNLECVLDYIPRHVKYMVREILKNAFRSTVERHLAKNGSDNPQPSIPPVVVELQQGDVHVIIKISDQGGGMSKRMQREAWQYGWTTVKAANDQNEAALYAEETCSWDRSAEPQSSAHAVQSELAGYGFGLPLTRLHAQYFGGDVFLQALPGLGTDMYLALTHLKEGTPSTEIDDLSTILFTTENSSTCAP